MFGFFGDALPINATDLIGQVQAAVDLGSYTEPNAPAGHPLFAADENGRQVVAWLQENQSLMASGVGSSVLAQAQAAIDAIYAAAATVTTSPGQPLAKTIFPAPATPIPWMWIGGGAAAIAVVAFLFHKKKKRGRR